MSKSSFSGDALPMAIIAGLMIGAALAGVAKGEPFLALVFGGLGIVALVSAIGKIADRVIDVIQKKTDSNDKEE